VPLAGFGGRAQVAGDLAARGHDARLGLGTASGKRGRYGETRFPIRRARGANPAEETGLEGLRRPTVEDQGTRKHGDVGAAQGNRGLAEKISNGPALGASGAGGWPRSGLPELPKAARISPSKVQCGDPEVVTQVSAR